MQRLSLIHCTSVLAVLVLACGGELPTVSPPLPPPPPPPAPVPAVGILKVTNTTSGTSLDPDGYKIMIDEGGGYILRLNDTARVENVPAGDHAIRLAGVAVNCTVAGSNPGTVTISPFDITWVEFAVTCAAPVPTTGSLEIRVVNTGSAPAQSSFRVAMILRFCGSLQACLASIRTVQVSELVPEIESLSPGSYHLNVVTVPTNCVLGGVQPQDPTVTVGQTAVVTLTASCR